MNDPDMSAVFVDHDGLRLHVLDHDARCLASPPVLVVPGMGEYADEYRWMLEALGPRRVAVVDVRGRGGSDVPASGYTWEHHVGDVRAVVESLGLERPVIVAFSRGSSYALGYALSEPDGVRGLVIGDYFARHVGLPDGFAERQLATSIRGTLVGDRMAEHAVRQVFAEGREIPLWHRLAELRCPVLVIRGGRRSALVTDEVAAQWRAALPTVRIGVVPDAGHDLWSRDVAAYLAVLRPFLAEIDAVSS